MPDLVNGLPGELITRLLDLVDAPGPQLRAVATTLLIKAVDAPGDEQALLEAVVSSDPAGSMIDPAAAAAARRRLRTGLASRLDDLAVGHGEDRVVVAMRDHLLAQVDRWATRTLDDGAKRRRAERFLAWADRPEQLAAAQRRGLFLGMDADEIRRLADERVAAPVSPELAVEVWEEVDRWLAEMTDRLGDDVVDTWRAAAA